MWKGVSDKLRRVELEEQMAQFMRTQRGNRSFPEFSRQKRIPISTQHRLENGQQNFTAKTLKMLKQKFNCTLADIFPHEFNGRNGNGKWPPESLR
jgi:hypothetical protein